MNAPDALLSRAEGPDALRAVIDIGSNSVRLVIFSGPPRAPIAICNEKALCGLGRSLSADGHLDPSAVAETIVTLRRFREILRAYDEPTTKVFATAAVRDAKNGTELVGSINALGFKLEIISGAEEAMLAAYGVFTVEPRAEGLVGDMGGGSLELIDVAGSAVGESISLPIGPLAVMRAVNADKSAAADYIAAALEKASFLGTHRDTLYAVGGAWRAIARIHMNLKQYPLSILHNYEIPAEAAIEICNLVARQSRRSLEEMPGISRKRTDTLPFAAIALKQLLILSRVEKMTISAGGAREGALYKDLIPDFSGRDPLLDACAFFAERYSPNAAFGAAAVDVVETLMVDSCAIDPRLVRAACELCDIAAFYQPDLRGRHAFDMVLSAPFYGVTHQERVWLALALLTRYQGRNAVQPNEKAISLISWDQQQTAIKMGLALRFVATLAPKSPHLLRGGKLVKTTEYLTFEYPAALSSLISETPRKRLDTLASALQTEAIIHFT